MKLLTSLLIGALFFFQTNVCCGQDVNIIGPQNMALGQIRSLDHSNWAVLTNVANLAFQKKISAGISYQRKFELAVLSSRIATVNFPNKFGVLTGLVLQSGSNESSISRYGLGYSRSFGPKVSAGIQFNYLAHQIEGAELADAFYASAGVVIKASSSIHLAAFVQNPEQGTIRHYETDYYLPSLFCIGVQWSADPHVLILAELEKELEYPPLYKSGVQFNFKDHVFVRTGISAKPVNFSFGGGFHYKSLVVDVGFVHHAILGLTSSFGLSFFIGSSK
ncbi:MAG: hypothetical protein JEZ14_10860 [Marinilabiliaceae bacterium]|nr:hypothetical protein [Marinilabiliaceae bacterium]